MPVVILSRQSYSGNNICAKSKENDHFLQKSDPFFKRNLWIHDATLSLIVLSVLRK